MFFTTFKFWFFFFFNFTYFFLIIIFTVINFTNFNFWIIKILVLPPKQSKTMSFPPEFFSDCCPLLSQGGPKSFYPLQKRARSPGFSLLGGLGETSPPAKNLLILPLPPPPHLEKPLPSRLPPPNFYSLPTKRQFPPTK